MKNKSARTLFLGILLTTTVMAVFAEENAPLPEVLTLREASELLRVEQDELVRMAGTNEIPARKFGKEWRFSQTAMLAWLAGKDPVGAVLVSSQPKRAENPPRNAESMAKGRNTMQPTETLAQAELSGIAARGGSSPGSQTSETQKKPETIGEKPELRTAEQVFLRDQAVLLKKRQMTLELGLLYARNDEKEVTILPDPSLFFLQQAQAKSNTFTSNFSVRYGLMDNLQVFSSIPLTHQSQTVSIGSQDIADSAATRWGNATAGLRYAALAEGSGYPSVILSLNGAFPTNNGAYGAGAGIALTKSIDPAVLFFNLGYTHYFNDETIDLTEGTADDQYNFTGGIAYALNDTLTLSTRLSAVFSSRSRLRNNFTLASREIYNLEFALTSFLTEGLYIEPSVGFGLNDDAPDLTIGLNLPYTFDL